MDIRYRVDTYGNSRIGWRFYNTTEIKIIEATQMTYLRKGFNLFICIRVLCTLEGRVAVLLGWEVIHRGGGAGGGDSFYLYLIYL